MQISHFFKTFIVIIQSLYITARICFKTIILASQNKLTRQWVDDNIRAWAKELMQIIKADVSVINPNNIQPKHGQATLIMCNHSSLFDIPLSYLAFPNLTLRMLAKKEMKKIPLMGKSMVAADFPFIDRHNRTQAIQDLQKVRELLADDVVMWIAPEGTRSADGQLKSFKKGGFITAIQAQAEIIPIVIRGANLILPARTFNLHMHQKVEVIVGDPIDASQYNLEQKEELIRLVHNSMQSMLEND